MWLPIDTDATQMMRDLKTANDCDDHHLNLFGLYHRLVYRLAGSTTTNLLLGPTRGVGLMFVGDGCTLLKASKRWQTSHICKYVLFIIYMPSSMSMCDVFLTI